MTGLPIIVTLVLVACGFKEALTQVPDGWILLLNEDFVGSTLSPIWRHEYGPKYSSHADELQYYTNGANVAVANGNLIITGRQERICDTQCYSYTSGRISTAGKANFWPGMYVGTTKLGVIKVEVRAKVPVGKGLWPAIWMLPDGYGKGWGAYGSWPASGEIDIMETVGAAKFSQATIHFGGYNSSGLMDKYKIGGRINTSIGNDYHTFTLTWRVGSMDWELDGERYCMATSRALDPKNGWWTYNKGSKGSPSMTPAEFAKHPHAPFDMPFFITLNLAIGGNWPGAPDTTTPWPSNYYIDYVRVFGEPVASQTRQT